MVKTTGPAVGSRAQLGYSEEGKWGFPTSPPTKFMEITSEAMTSEFTNLVSASLRADRAVHKQRTGTETAGGDVNFEVAPEGPGTFFKHAMGRRLTKRRDVAVVAVYKGTDVDRMIKVTSSAITSWGTTSGDDLAITITNGMTVNAVISAIHNSTNWDAYAPYGDGTDGTSGGYFTRALANKLASGHTRGSEDYIETLAKTAGAVTNLETFTKQPVFPDVDANGLVFFPINYKYGVYAHYMDAYEDLPPGMTFEIGRDIAAFNYYGAKVNSLSMTINPGEIVTGTFNVMARGASTCGDPVVVGTNTGWIAPFISMRYAGTAANALMEVDTADGSMKAFYFADGVHDYEKDTYHFSLTRGYFSHDGYYFETTHLAGLLELLEYSGYFSITRKAGWAPYTLCSTITNVASADLSSSVDTNLTLAINASIAPLFRGHYIGADAGESINVYVDITTGGRDGTAKFKGSVNNSAWNTTATTITHGIWYTIFNGSDLDTGFDVLWPENITHVSGDTWYVTTFKDENATVSYETEDPFTGFQGALTLDMGYGSGSQQQGVMGMTFTLNNNLFGDKFELGDRTRAALVPQRRTTEGTITTEFDNLDLYRMFVNGQPGDLTCTLLSDQYINSSPTQYSLELRFPELKFSGSTPVVGGPEIITTDFPFVALYDDTAGISDMRMILTNSQSYI